MKMFTNDTITTFFRQCLNCWLAYTLSQPVDIDLPVALHFMKLYLGIPLVESVFIKLKNNVAPTFMDTNTKETIEELVTQESYS